MTKRNGVRAYASPFMAAMFAVFIALASPSTVAETESVISGSAVRSHSMKQLSDGLYMSGIWTASFNANLTSMSINLPYIYNYRYTTTGTLRLTFWATTSPPARGSAFTGYRLATFSNLSPLPSYYQYSNVSQSASMLVPPNGTYWLVLVLEEYDPSYCPAASGFCVEDTHVSAEQRTFGSVAPTTYMLTINDGIGSSPGSVSVSPTGASCGPTYVAGRCFLYAAGTVVTVTPLPSLGSEFDRWNSACLGKAWDECVITMDYHKSVGIWFRYIQADVALTQTVNANPAGTGKDAVFTVTATNNGPSSADGTMITMTYDPTAALIWVSPSCASQGGTTVACSFGSLGIGASKTFKLVLRRIAVGTMYNNATVSASTTDSITANNAANVSVSVVQSPTGVPVQRYRLYSPVTLEHHFTTDLNEYNVLGTHVGTWVQEGTVGKILNNPGEFGGVAGIPYYRLYDNATRWHHWTTDPNEYYTLGYVHSGWNMEGVDGYILPAQAPGTVRLYRLNYPALGSLHHWTIDANEYNTLITPAYGWVGEGGSGFVIQ